MNQKPAHPLWDSTPTPATRQPHPSHPPAPPTPTPPSPTHTPITCRPKRVTEAEWHTGRQRQALAINDLLTVTANVTWVAMFCLRYPLSLTITLVTRGCGWGRFHRAVLVNCIHAMFLYQTQTVIIQIIWVNTIATDALSQQQLRCWLCILSSSHHLSMDSVD